MAMLEARRAAQDHLESACKHMALVLFRLRHREATIDDRDAAIARLWAALGDFSDIGWPMVSVTAGEDFRAIYNNTMTQNAALREEAAHEVALFAVYLHGKAKGRAALLAEGAMRIAAAYMPPNPNEPDDKIAAWSVDLAEAVMREIVLRRDGLSGAPTGIPSSPDSVSRVETPDATETDRG